MGRYGVMNMQWDYIEDGSRPDSRPPEMSAWGTHEGSPTAEKLVVVRIGTRLRHERKRGGIIRRGLVELERFGVVKDSEVVVLAFKRTIWLGAGYARLPCSEVFCSFFDAGCYTPTNFGSTGKDASVFSLLMTETVVKVRFFVRS